MATDKKTNKYEIVDFFAQIAAGGKKLITRIPPLSPVSPLALAHEELPKAEATEIALPKFDEQKEYERFLEEKKALRARYQPFLENYARAVNTPLKSEALVDFDYRKETEADCQDFSLVLGGQGEWERVKLPHYVGPAGIWTAFYKTTIRLQEKDTTKEYVIDFEAVDYIAEVYLNGRLVAHHTGFFTPFTAILTPYIKTGDNTLVVVVRNDIPTKGASIDGITHYGNKIYAATHLGYDEPYEGWHHCPAGAGIFGKVRFITCEKQRIADIYVRPDIDHSKITVYTTFYNFLRTHTENQVRYTVEGRNFKKTVFENYEGKIKRTLVEENYLEEEFEIPNPRLWTTDEPYLYEITVTLLDKEGNIVDEKQTHFGMRKFHMDENSTPKGKFYFNNARIILRGTNEMGHLPRCVMNGDYEQLIDDILIAKVAHLNFYRMTQRPVFDEIYTYFDMLGMLCQTDFPAFLFIRESVVGEALKQVDEMERLTRNHPSVIIESFCNETADSEDYGWEQYGLGRIKMQNFFDSARQAVLLSNPDRVVKYCDGDYSPVAESYGVSDFHCYTYWYTSHGVPSGKFEKGYLPPFRPEWMAGCGEYGVDGLDRLELMKKYFPKEWLPATDDEAWTPKIIPKAQCFNMHGQYFPEQDNIRDWIKESREWQRIATKKYVHALRRRVDYVQSRAVHLLIDAWPSGWTKTLVDVERIPKPAYYAFKEANIPVRVSIRTDKSLVYDDDSVITEFFALNDLAVDKKTTVRASVYYDGKLQCSYEKTAVAKATAATYLGDVIVKPKGFFGTVEIVAEMTVDGEKTYDSLSFEVKPRNKKASFVPTIYSDKLQEIVGLCEGEVSEKVIFCDNDSYRAMQDELEEKAFNGARVIVFTNRPINVLDENILFKVHNLAEELGTTKVLLYHNPEHPFVKEFPPISLKNIYNADTDYQDLIAWFHFDWQGSEEILYDVLNENKDPACMRKNHKMVMASKKHGKGEIIVSTLTALKGCIGCNPYYDKLFINLIEKKTR